MVTKRPIKRVAPDAEDGHPSVPPGFEYLTSFTLRRKSTDDPMDVDGVVRNQGQYALLLAMLEKFKSSFPQSPWICYGRSDRVPQKCDSDPTEIDTKDPVRTCLPKGVIWGCADCPDCVKIPQISPSILVSEGIPVYRRVQNPMEFVVTFSGAYHTDFCCGFNCAESVWFAPFDWLPHGQNTVELYAQHCLRTSISHDKLLLGAAVEVVKAQWESVKLKRNSVNNQLWTSVCGNDGILTRALKSCVQDEGIRRKHLCNWALSSPSGGFDATTKQECIICSYDLYLSSVSCLCSPNKYSCLPHAKQLCPCPWSSKQFFFRYGMTELGLLVEALEGNQKAIHGWVKGKAQPGDAFQFKMMSFFLVMMRMTNKF